MSLLIPCVPGSLTSPPPVPFSSLPSPHLSWAQPESCHDQKLCYRWHFFPSYLTFVPSAHHFLFFQLTCSGALTAVILQICHNFSSVVLSLGNLKKKKKKNQCPGPFSKSIKYGKNFGGRPWHRWYYFLKAPHVIFMYSQSWDPLPNSLTLGLCHCPSTLFFSYLI